MNRAKVYLDEKLIFETDEDNIVEVYCNSDTIVVNNTIYDVVKKSILPKNWGGKEVKLIVKPYEGR